MKSSLSHIALLVPSVVESARVLNASGIKTNDPEVFESEGTKEIYVGSYDTHRGLLLLLEPISEGPYQNTMSKRGPSLHHIAIDVLSVEESISDAQEIGWKLHPISEETLSYKTAWLYCEGAPSLIEVQQKKELSPKPLMVSQLGLPLQKEHQSLFDDLGLGSLVSPSPETNLTVKGQTLNFSKIACLD